MNESDFTSAITDGREISFSASASLSDRTIQGSLLERAFVTNAGRVVIENAIINGPVDLSSATIAGHIALRNCIFDALALRYCTITGFFSLTGSVLNTVDLRGSQFNRALWLRGTEIKGRLHLGYVTVGVEVDLDQITVHGDLYAYATLVSRNVHMRDAICKGDVEFSRLKADGQFDVKGATFSGHFSMRDGDLGSFATEDTVFKKDAILERTRVHSSMHLLAREVNTLNCVSLNVGGQLVIKGMRVNETTYLEAVECLDLLLLSCTFAGKVSMIGAHVFSLEINECAFNDEVKLNSLRCDANIGFTDSDGLIVHFDAAIILGSVRIAAKQKSVVTFQDLFLYGAQIGNQLIFEGLRLNGLLVLESAKIKADLQFMDGLVLGGIAAMGAVVEGTCTFQGTLVGGPADFAGFSVGDQLMLVGAEFLSELRIWNLKVGSHVDCREAFFERGARFDRAELPGQVILYDVVAADVLSFRDANVGAFFFDKSLTAENGDADFPFRYVVVDLRGCRYQQISVNWRNLVTALALRQVKSRDRQPFVELERYLRSIGIDEWADAVYYTSRKVAGDQHAFGPAKVADRLVRFVSGYGVRLHHVVRALLLVIAALWLFFSIPGAARPTSIHAAGYGCDATPDLLDRLALAVVTVVPVPSKVVDGWTISDCPMRSGTLSVGSVEVPALNLGKPFVYVALAQLLTLVLLPFLVSTVMRSLRYSGRES